MQAFPQVRAAEPRSIGMHLTHECRNYRCRPKGRRYNYGNKGLSEGMGLLYTVLLRRGTQQ
jgi:hypothetical protein